MRRNHGIPLWQAAEKLAGAEGELLARIPVYVIRGTREAEIWGCAGILEYGSGRVRLAMERGEATVTGENLTLEDFEDGILTVRGVIEGIAFGEEENP